MKEYRCRITITDIVEAESKEGAQKEFLDVVDELGASHYYLPRDVEVEE